MKEEKVNKRKFMDWVKDHSVEITSGFISICSIVVGAVMYQKVTREKKVLMKKNQELENENRELRGQVIAGEKENRRLNRENGNLNYQLGKMASKQQNKC